MKYPTLIMTLACSSSILYGQSQISTLVGWGQNEWGELNFPEGATNLVEISCGHYYTVGLRADGAVMAWGDNRNGRGALEVPSNLRDVASISAGVEHVLALKKDGTVTAWGFDLRGQAKPPPGLSNVIALAAGGEHSLALRADGTVVAWGANIYGQRNVPADLKGVVDISAGFYHSLALLSDGSVVAWGHNKEGAGSVPAGLPKAVQISAGYYHNMILTTDGRVLAWGKNLGHQTDVPPELQEVGRVYAAPFDSFAVKKDGTATVWTGGYWMNPFPTNASPIVRLVSGAGFGFALLGGAEWPLVPRGLSVHRDGPRLIVSADVIGNGPFVYQWLLNRLPIPAETNSTLVLEEGFRRGLYSLRISKGPAIAQLIPVLLPPDLTLSINRKPGGFDITWPAGTPVQIERADSIGGPFSPIAVEGHNPDSGIISVPIDGAAAFFIGRRP